MNKKLEQALAITMCPSSPITPAVPDEKVWRKIQMLTVFSGIKHMGGVILDMTSGNMAKQFMKANKFKRLTPKRREQLKAYRDARLKQQFEKTFVDFLDICAKEKVMVSEQVAKEMRADIEKLQIPDIHIKTPKP